MALFHVLIARLARLLGLAVILTLVAAAAAPAASLNLQTVTQRARSDTWARCKDFANRHYTHIEFAGSLGECASIHVGRPKYTVLSARKAKVDTEFTTRNWLTGGNRWHCYQRLYFKGSGDAVTIYKRSRQDCLDDTTG